MGGLVKVCGCACECAPAKMRKHGFSTQFRREMVEAFVKASMDVAWMKGLNHRFMEHKLKKFCIPLSPRMRECVARDYFY